MFSFWFLANLKLFYMMCLHRAAVSKIRLGKHLAHFNGVKNILVRKRWPKTWKAHPSRNIQMAFYGLLSDSCHSILTSLFLLLFVQLFIWVQISLLFAKYAIKEWLLWLTSSIETEKEKRMFFFLNAHIGHWFWTRDRTTVV